MTNEQRRDWQHLVNECELHNHKSINVGGKRMRAMLLAVNEEIKRMIVEVGMLQLDKSLTDDENDIVDRVWSEAQDQLIRESRIGELQEERGDLTGVRGMTGINAKEDYRKGLDLSQRIHESKMEVKYEHTAS